MTCSGHIEIRDSALPSLSGRSYFAVGPFVDLGTRVDVACMALGWDGVSDPPRASGFVFVAGGEHVRADIGDSQADVHNVARIACAENCVPVLIGEAERMIGDRILYRAVELYDPVPAATLFAKAHDAAVDIMDVVFKARANIDPSRPRNRAIIVRRTADAMVSKARPWERRAYSAGEKFLRANWPQLTAAERDAIIAKASRKILDIPVRAVRGINDVISTEADGVFKGARKSAIKKFKLNIGANLTLPDERAIKAMQRTTVSWLTNEYGTRAASFESIAKEIVEHGMERGLGRDDISQELVRRFGTSISGRSESYYNVFAGAIVDRSRTRSELHSYREAGLTKYVASSVLDEATTDFCRWVDGKVLDVQESIAIQERAERPDMSVDDMKRANPWARVDADGNVYVRGPRGKANLFRVDRSGIGTQSTGQYTTRRAGGKLGANGVGGPPYHGNCRTATIIET